jgi:hypothetical protein
VPRFEVFATFKVNTMVTIEAADAIDAAHKVILSNLVDAKIDLIARAAVDEDSSMDDLELEIVPEGDLTMEEWKSQAVQFSIEQTNDVINAMFNSLSEAERLAHES